MPEFLHSLFQPKPDSGTQRRLNSSIPLFVSVLKWCAAIPEFLCPGCFIRRVGAQQNTRSLVSAATIQEFLYRHFPHNLVARRRMISSRSSRIGWVPSYIAALRPEGLCDLNANIRSSS
jgi:hypothetical protein